MKNEKKHDLINKVDSIIGSSKFHFSKSKEEAWDYVQSQINDESTVRLFRVKRINNYLLRVAAVMLVLFGIPTIMKTYHVTVTSNGEAHAITLPDGSEARLTSESELTYHPLWWGISRRLTLEGSAYFSVVKGNSFTVKSHNGITRVLGTSFTVNSSADVYKVVCHTGKVSVHNAHQTSNVILLPNQQAVYENGKFNVSETNETASGLLNSAQLTFSSVPISKVFEKLCAEYNVKIKLEVTDTLKYSGTFDKPDDILQSLDLVCKPFNLTFVQKSNGEFVIGYK